MSFLSMRVILACSFLVIVCGCQQATLSLAEPGDHNAAAAQPSGLRPPGLFVGRSSCSAVACHGDAVLEPVSWRNAYNHWETNDPHRRAFEVLYTERSVQMYRRLERVDSPQLDDDQYLQFLELKCIGCHATPPPGSGDGESRSLHAAASAYWQGVACESCHGPASGWIDAHYLQSWPTSESPERARQTAVNGYRDTKSLATRAEVCLECHHGPQYRGERLYDVSHDLIAAGHPRLTFELHAYLDNLPEHWDDQAFGAKRPFVHFETWRAGQWQQKQQATLLHAAREKLAAESGGVLEFASYDCLACHRPLGERGPRLVDLAQESLAQSTLASLHSQLTMSERAALLRQLLAGSRAPSNADLLPSCDQAVQILLAANAFAKDLPPGTWRTELDALQRSISAQAGTTQYDLPARFDSQAADFQQALRDLDAAVDATVNQPPP